MRRLVMRRVMKSIFGKDFVFLFVLSLLLTACSSGNNSGSGKPAENAKTEGSAKPANTQPTDNAKAEATKKAMKKTVSIGTHPNGSSYNSTGVGIASVLSTNSPIQVTVKPFAGPVAWIPLMDKGELELGLSSAPDVAWAFRGTNNYKPNKNVRVLVRGNFAPSITYTVRKDSNIKKVTDLKGKKVASDYAGASIVKAQLEAQLAAAGLTWNDVKQVPVPSTVAGIDALREGRVDAAFGLSPTTPAVIEANNAVGLRALNFYDAPASEVKNLPKKVYDELTSRVPGARIVAIKEGFVTEDTLILEWPITLSASAKLSEEAAYQIVKSLFENYRKLHPIYAWLKGWVPETMFDPNPPAPYHPGAVRYFKEKGLWNDKAEKNQQELMKSAK